MAKNANFQAFCGSQLDRTSFGRQKEAASNKNKTISLVAKIQRDFYIVSQKEGFKIGLN